MSLTSFCLFVQQMLTVSLAFSVSGPMLTTNTEFSPAHIHQKIFGCK